MVFASWVLILVTWVSGGYGGGGSSVTAIEFSSKEKCEAASAALTGEMKHIGPGLHGTCAEQ